MYIKSLSTKHTIKLAEKFSRFLKPKDVVILEGQLGGGKTTFVKGILKGFGIKRAVLSPTFTLMREYKKGNIYIYHVDLYRIEKNDIDEIGFEDFLYRKNCIVLIEWGNKISKLLSDYIKIRFKFLTDTSRGIFFSLTSGYLDRMDLLKKYLT